MSGQPEASAGRASLTERELAAFLNVTERTIRRWAAAGCPRERADAGWRFDPLAVEAWRAARIDAEGERMPRVDQDADGRRQAPNEYREARIRRERAAAALLEQRLAIESGKLIDAERAKAHMASCAHAVRTRLEALPERFAIELASLGGDVGAVRELLRRMGDETQRGIPADYERALERFLELLETR